MSGRWLLGLAAAWLAAATVVLLLNGTLRVFNAAVLGLNLLVLVFNLGRSGYAGGRRSPPPG